MSAYWDKAIRLTPSAEPILSIPEHIKALPEDQQGPALVEEMLALVRRRPGPDNAAE